MKLIRHKLLLLWMLGLLISACTKELEQDEYTTLLLNKKEKLQKLDDLFDLSFENASEAEKNYQTFVEYELLTETQNFLEDADISWRNARTDLAIRMNAHFSNLSQNLPDAMFDLYKAKFETNVLNRTLLGQSPQQLRFDDRFEKFKKRVDEIDGFFNEKITDFKKATTTNTDVINKKWLLSNKVVGGTPDNPYGIYVVNFDFTLLADNGMNINRFFFFPYIPKPNGSFYTEQVETAYSTVGFVESDLIGPAEYIIHGHKITFYFHLKNNIDPLLEGVGKPEREWVFEYEYSVSNNRLVLTKPRMVLSMYPHLLSAEPGDDIYQKYYSDRLKEFTLNAD